MTVPPPGCPARTPDPVSLYGPEFAADPHGVYAALRGFGPVAPVEVAPGVTAFLVTGRQAALEVLRDTEVWSKDSRAWEELLPEETLAPVKGMLGWRPNVMFNDGEVHARYRRVITDSYSLVEPRVLRAEVERIADFLIGRFADKGTADLLGDYARPLVLYLFNSLYGQDDSHGDRLIAALNTMVDGTAEGAAQGMQDYLAYTVQLVTAKSEQPGADITSWFLDHPNELSFEEVMHQVFLTFAAGTEPTASLIVGVLARMLSDDRYYTDHSSGTLTAAHAIEEVLWDDPPVANYSCSYAKREVFFHNMWIRPGQLVLVSLAAVNSDPEQSEGRATGRGSHLAWSAGPHACPVKPVALNVVTTAVERLVLWCNDIELAVEFKDLVRRQGPFLAGLEALPARFTPIRRDRPGATPWITHAPHRSPQSSPEDSASSRRQPGSAATATPSP